MSYFCFYCWTHKPDESQDKSAPSKRKCCMACSSKINKNIFPVAVATNAGTIFVSAESAVMKRAARNKKSYLKGSTLGIKQ